MTKHINIDTPNPTPTTLRSLGEILKSYFNNRCASQGSDTPVLDEKRDTENAKRQIKQQLKALLPVKNISLDGALGRDLSDEEIGFNTAVDIMKAQIDDFCSGKGNSK